eukprot:gnl/MRDRNA2_/MRDRNA2_571119_c0_seq1.p1 gnl/MRDRNA2_/MRDRNA2_571119_c0~~gnl/MRDRNA2_/MRDRNA2_571119_c0_seq1.p1  ORF type:complete len:114 (-),score=26.88 gnl/MRDRNA2_/MRDRNA2_571119_c0_seq1:52-357(-)
MSAQLTYAESIEKQMTNCSGPDHTRLKYGIRNVNLSVSEEIRLVIWPTPPTFGFGGGGAAARLQQQKHLRRGGAAAAAAVAAAAATAMKSGAYCGQDNKIT